MKKMKKMIFALLTATMLLGSGTTVLADDIHNYNILVSDTYYDTSSYSHTHYVGGENGTTVPMNCVVIVYYMRRIMKCHCGATQMTEYTTTHHSVYN